MSGSNAYSTARDVTLRGLCGEGAAVMQYALSFDAPIARSSDPSTSHAAADAAKDLQARHHRIIMDALRSHGPAGKDRLAVLTSLTGVQVCRRLVELDRGGLIKWTGRTVKSTAGRQEREWMVA